MYICTIPPPPSYTTYMLRARYALYSVILEQTSLKSQSKLMKHIRTIFRGVTYKGKSLCSIVTAEYAAKYTRPCGFTVIEHVTFYVIFYECSTTPFLPSSIVNTAGTRENQRNCI